jgi:hypothetical protein
VADDYFSEEYALGVDGKSDFKSRFLAWHLFGAYKTKAPIDWEAPDYYQPLLKKNVSLDQCYWHYKKTRELTDKLRLREYPSYDSEAFLLGGESFFDTDAIQYYLNNVQKPISEGVYVSSLQATN